jgi:hypothetical protein
VPGLLTLETGKLPQGVAYGGVTRDSDGPAGVFTFPHYSQHERLVFMLANGGSALLAGATLDHGFNEDARVYASAAIVSAGDLREVDTFTGVVLQIEYLDAIAGVAPLSSVKIPRGSNKSYGAEPNGDFGQAWKDGSATVDLGYRGEAAQRRRRQSCSTFSCQSMRTWSGTFNPNLLKSVCARATPASRGLASRSAVDRVSVAVSRSAWIR